MSEETTVDKTVQAQIAFLVVQNANGAYLAINDLDTKVEVARPASLQDMKIACQEITEAINRAVLVNTIKGVFGVPTVNPEETSAPEAQ